MMKKALVRPDMARVFQVEAESFQVAPPLQWIDCADDVRPETHDFDGTSIVLKSVSQLTLAQKRARIDARAESVRVRYVPHPLMVAEYEQAELEAKAFKDGGYSGAPPASVSAWAAAKSWTAQQAADDILAAATQLRGKLMQIRSARLVGKEAVAVGTKTLEQVLAELDAL